jgi:DNA-binding response OmpR family regulator
VISDGARNSHSTPDVSELLRSRRGELDSLGYHLLRYGQKFFSGRLDIHSSLMECKWSIFFAKGRIAWATGGKSGQRRSQRNLNRFFPHLKSADLEALDTTGHETYWDYYLLQLLLQRQLVDLEPTKNLIEASILEVCFDILQQEALETTHYQTVYAAANFLWSVDNAPLTGLVWKPSPIFAVADQAWQEWQAAKLGACSPNAAPILRAREKVKQHTSEKVYRSFCKGFNGDRSLRDLACLMKKDLLRISKSLLPYIRRGWIELIEIPDRERRSSKSEPKATDQIATAAVANQDHNTQSREAVSQNLHQTTATGSTTQAQVIAAVKPTAIDTIEKSATTDQPVALEIKPAPELETSSPPINLPRVLQPSGNNSSHDLNKQHDRPKRQDRWQRRKRANAASKFQELKIAFLDPDELDDAEQLDSPFQDIHDHNNDQNNRNGQEQKLEIVATKPDQPPLIACIDDSRAIGLLMRDIITKAGYRFIYIEDPLKAIATLKAEQPSLIFLDLIMPGATGFQVCAQLRRMPEFKTLPVIMLTSNRGIIDRIHARWVRTNEYLNKPVKADQVLSTIANYLPDALPLSDRRDDSDSSVHITLNSSISAVASNSNSESVAADVIPLAERSERSQLNKADANKSNGLYVPVSHKTAEP